MDQFHERRLGAHVPAHEVFGFILGQKAVGTEGTHGLPGSHQHREAAVVCSQGGRVGGMSGVVLRCGVDEGGG